jgi:hypothetical protein
MGDRAYLVLEAYPAPELLPGTEPPADAEPKDRQQPAEGPAALAEDETRTEKRSLPPTSRRPRRGSPDRGVRPR